MGKDPYKKIAKTYDRCVEPSIAVIRQIGIKMYTPKDGMHVLDVGCGTGTNLMLYHEAGCNIFGIDLSPAMVEVAQKKLGDRAEIRIGDASKMPYSDDSFDLVTGIFTLHEMPSQIRSTVINEMVRVVKHGDRILLIDYHLGPIHFPKGWMYKALIQSQICKYRPIKTDAVPTGLKKIMEYKESETVAKRYNKKKKYYEIKLFFHGKKYIFNVQEKIKAISQRLQGVEITNEDGWKLIEKMSAEGDFVLVDPSYLGKSTSNYNKSTQEDSDPEVYMEKVLKYLIPAADRGARLLITNNWDNEVVRKFRNLGFLVFKALRVNGKPEFVAINFDPETGIVYPRVKGLDIESTVNRHGKKQLTDQSSSDYEKIGSIQGNMVSKTYALFLKSSEKLDEIESSSIHMIVTSPPYVNLRKIGAHPDKYVEWFMPLAKEIKRVLVDDGNFVMNINEIVVKGRVHPYLDDLKYELRKIGLNQIAKPYIWYKTTVTPNRCSHRAIDRYEYCYWFSNGKGTFYRNNVRRPYSDNTIKRVENYDVSSLGTRGEKGHKVSKKSKIDPRGAFPLVSQRFNHWRQHFDVSD